MKIIKLPRNLQYPISRSGCESDVYLMREGWPYVCADVLVRQLEEMESRDFEVTDMEANWEGQKDYKPGATLTILCPGGIGDLLCLRAVLAQMREQYPGLLIHIGATPLDRSWLGAYVDKISPYPVPLEAVQAFDYVVSLEEMHRRSPERELYDAFADILHVELGPEPPQLLAPLVLNQAERDLAAYRVRSDSGRPKLGIQVSSAAHYRSYPNHLSALMALELTREGHRRRSEQLFDVYLFGNMFQSLKWRVGRDFVAPPDHVFDICGRYQSNAEMIALIDQMDVLVVPDSAILHIGAFLSKLTLALFSITQATHRTTYYPDVMYIQGQADCAPCEDIAAYPPCGERYCKAMLSISPYYAAEIISAMYETGGVIKEGVPYEPERHGPAELAVSSASA